MSRSGYSDDIDGWQLICWRGAVASAIRGPRGQRLLRDLAEAMDAMPVKELIAHALEAEGRHCALGVVGAKRGVDMREMDPEDSWQVSRAFDIAQALAKEIVYVNDETGWGKDKNDPALRWKRVREWVAENIKAAA